MKLFKFQCCKRNDTLDTFKEKPDIITEKSEKTMAPKRKRIGETPKESSSTELDSSKTKKATNRNIETEPYISAVKILSESPLDSSFSEDQHVDISQSKEKFIVVQSNSKKADSPVTSKPSNSSISDDVSQPPITEIVSGSSKLARKESQDVLLDKIVEDGINDSKSIEDDGSKKVKTLVKKTTSNRTFENKESDFSLVRKDTIKSISSDKKSPSEKSLQKIINKPSITDPVSTRTSSPTPKRRKTNILFSSEKIEVSALPSSRSESSTSSSIKSLISEEEQRNEIDKDERYDGWSAFIEDYGVTSFGNTPSTSFLILGTSAMDSSTNPKVCSPMLLECLQNFVPYSISESNLWLKYSMVRDGSDLNSLMNIAKGLQYTLIAIENMDGEVFGAFTGTPWERNSSYYGSGEAFLWKLRHSRLINNNEKLIREEPTRIDTDLEVYPYSAIDNYVQRCTDEELTVGGGLWSDDNKCPYDQYSGRGLVINSDLSKGTSGSCSTFANPSLSKLYQNGDSFEIKNIELWTYTPCMSVIEAEKVELRKKLFVHDLRN